MSHSLKGKNRWRETPGGHGGRTKKETDVPIRIETRKHVVLLNCQIVHLGVRPHRGDRPGDPPVNVEGFHPDCVIVPLEDAKRRYHVSVFLRQSGLPLAERYGEPRHV